MDFIEKAALFSNSAHNNKPIHILMTDLGRIFGMPIGYLSRSTDKPSLVLSRNLAGRIGWGV